MRPAHALNAVRSARAAGAAAALASALVAAPPAAAQDAAALQAHHVALRDQLANNAFQRPLAIESSQTSGDLKGDVYAVVDQPFVTVGQALQGTDHWCDLLMLHLNVKNCQTGKAKGGDTLSLNIGRKFDQPLADAYLVDFNYKVAAARLDYLQVVLDADKGPMGTSDYRIEFEAVALDAKRSFVHMSYSYAYGLAARLAMQGYLATVGRDKVGFSVVEHKSDGKPVYIGGVRSVVERNTMRYYLAIEAYLNAYLLPPAQQTEKRLNDWFAAVERYPVQLQELERGEYLAMKHREIERQRDLAARPK